MGALRAPLAGSPAFVFAFVFVSIAIKFELRNETTENWLTDPHHDRKTAYDKKMQKTKSVSNDRSRHDDSNGPRIFRIGAILAIFEHFKVLLQRCI